MHRYVVFVLLLMASSFFATAQSVGIGTSFPTSSAQLDIYSTTKGLLIPRMTTDQRRAIPGPVSGLMVYDYTTNSIWTYNGSTNKWEELISSFQNQAHPALTRTVPGGSSGDQFGFAVGCGGGHVVISAPGKNSLTGSVYYGARQGENNTYALQEFTGIGYGPGDRFGFSVALDKETGGNDWIAGAPFDDNTLTDQGSVYIYNPDYAPDVKLYSPTPQASENFGASVDITGQSYNEDQYAIVGAPGKNAGTGGAYIFHYGPGGWTLVTTINPTAPNNGDGFGTSVSICYNRTTGDGWAFIGAPYDDNVFTNDGSVSVYKRNITTGAWSFLTKIYSAAPMAGAYFGNSVASNMRCSTGVVIGEPGYSINKGRVYYSFFTGPSTFQTPVLLDEGQYSNTYLGFSVAASTFQDCMRSYLLAGAYKGTQQTTTSDWGNAKYFTLINNTGSWIAQGKTIDPDGYSGWHFGYAVGVDNRGWVAIGAPNSMVGNNAAQGKAIFEIFPSY